jgi:hypothetical protein
MATPHAVVNAQLITQAIEKAFVTANLDDLPEMLKLYRSAIVELTAGPDACGIHSNKDISLQAVAERLLQMRTDDGYGLFKPDLDAYYIVSVTETLPVDVQMAETLLRLAQCPINKLCDKFMQTQYSYRIDADLERFLRGLAKSNQVAADRVFCDMLDEKTTFGAAVGIAPLAAVLRLMTTLDKPSSRLLSLLKDREPDLIKRFDLQDGAANLRALAETVKLPLNTFANLKRAGCDELIDKIMQADGLDHTPKVPMNVFFKEGGVLPDAFLKKALASDRLTTTMNLAFLEVLVKPTEDALEAVSRLRTFLQPDWAKTHNSMAERWFKTLGDSIEIAKELGSKVDKSVIIGLIEAVAENIDNPAILKGSTLASGIDGRLLSLSPSLKAFKGDYVVQELGL